MNKKSSAPEEFLEKLRKLMLEVGQWKGLLADIFNIQLEG